MARNVILLAVLVGAFAVDAETTPKPAERPTLEEYKAAQAKKAENKSAIAAKDSKMAAVNKVTAMMETLQEQVIAEGEKEAATYDKFACFCKDMTRKKTKAIKKGRDEKEELSAAIEKLSLERDELDKKIAGLNTDIEKAEKDMATAQAESDKAFALYEKNAADLTAALYGVREAIKVMKASQTPSLVQIQSASKTIRTALMLADALGLKSAKSPALVLLQDAPEVEMENYKFHSSGIIETLEGLLSDFQKTKNDVDADEVARVQEFNMAKQKHTDYVKAKNLELDESKDTKDQKVADIAENSQELTTVSAQLLDDQQYLSELSAGCSAKAKTWDQRSKMRVAELTAITEAMDIVKATVVERTTSATIRFVQMPSTMHTADVVVDDEEAMMALEAEAEDTEASGPIAFLQRRQMSVAKQHQMSPNEDTDLVKQMLVSMLKSKGAQLKSTLLLSLSSQIGGDPFAKIKKLIQELIERLLQEAANEANQKGWCDKALADAKQKRDMAVEKADELNAEMAKLEAVRNKLAEELKVLTEEIGELTKAQAEAEQMRSDEKKENKETVYEAKQGLEATNMAIKILSRFYATAAQATVDLSLTQQSPFDDAPDAGFKDGEAYTAAGSDSGGIVGMLEVIASDFTRTITETIASEKKADAEHLEFMTESSKSLAEKNMAGQQKTKYQDETNDKLDTSENSLQTQTDLLVTSIEELIKLQPACIDTGMSYADRVAMREQEIESLKKALCILGAYAEYGPDGLADRC